MINKRLLGSEKEDYAYKYLTDHGVRIVDKNFRSKKGEIDIIGYDGETLVFFEVKFRSDSSKGYASEAVGYTKQKTISRVSDFYRMKNNIPDTYPCRFDVIAIDGENVSWIKNAFYYISNR